MKLADEPAYLTVGTDVSAKYRGAFCEAKIKLVKRLLKLKVTFKHDHSTQLVQDDQVKGSIRVGALVEVKVNEGTTFQEAVINKITDASWYTVVFDDGDEKTLRRSSLCLKGERHFAESETLDHLPLSNPEHFGTPVMGKKSNRGRRSSPIVPNEEEEESSSSEEEDEDQKRINDDLLGKVMAVDSVGGERKCRGFCPVLVVSPACSDEITVKKDFCLVRSFKDGKFHVVLRSDLKELNLDSAPKLEPSLKSALESALEFREALMVPPCWRSELSEDSSTEEDPDDDDGPADEEEDDDGGGRGSNGSRAQGDKTEPEEEPNPEEKENFLQQLYKFMDDRGTPINKTPFLGYRVLNLFKLYRLVQERDGYICIDSGAVWKLIYKELGLPILNSAASYNVKTAYGRYLHGFEEYCKSAGIRFNLSLTSEPKAEEPKQQQQKPQQPKQPQKQQQKQQQKHQQQQQKQEAQAEGRLDTSKESLQKDATPIVKKSDKQPAEEKERPPSPVKSVKAVKAVKVVKAVKSVEPGENSTVAKSTKEDVSSSSESEKEDEVAKPQRGRRRVMRDIPPRKSITPRESKKEGKPEKDEGVREDNSQEQDKDSCPTPSTAAVSTVPPAAPAAAPIENAEGAKGESDKPVRLVEPCAVTGDPAGDESQVKEEECNSSIADSQGDCWKYQEESADLGAGSSDVTSPKQELKDKADGDISDTMNEGEEGVEELLGYPLGTKVRVKYGRGKSLKIYEAIIKDVDTEGEEDTDVIYLVHYYGWNVRYDEWVKEDRIIRPVDKNIPKIKHRRKTKNKADRDKAEALRKEEKRQEPGVGRGRRGPVSGKSPPGCITPPLRGGHRGGHTGTGRGGHRTTRSGVSPLTNGHEGMQRRHTRRSSGVGDFDKKSDASNNFSSDSEMDDESSSNSSERQEVDDGFATSPDATIEKESDEGAEESDVLVLLVTSPSQEEHVVDKDETKPAKSAVPQDAEELGAVAQQSSPRQQQQNDKLQKQQQQDQQQKQLKQKQQQLQQKQLEQQQEEQQKQEQERKQELQKQEMQKQLEQEQKQQQQLKQEQEQKQQQQLRQEQEQKQQQLKQEQEQKQQQQLKQEQKQQQLEQDQKQEQEKKQQQLKQDQEQKQQQLKQEQKQQEQKQQEQKQQEQKQQEQKQQEQKQQEQKQQLKQEQTQQEQKQQLLKQEQTQQEQKQQLLKQQEQKQQEQIQQEQKQQEQKQQEQKQQEQKREEQKQQELKQAQKQQQQIKHEQKQQEQKQQQQLKQEQKQQQQLLKQEQKQQQQQLKQEQKQQQQLKQEQKQQQQQLKQEQKHQQQQLKQEQKQQQQQLKQEQKQQQQLKQEQEHKQQPKAHQLPLQQESVTGELQLSPAKEPEKAAVTGPKSRVRKERTKPDSVMEVLEPALPVLVVSSEEASDSGEERRVSTETDGEGCLLAVPSGETPASEERSSFQLALKKPEEPEEVSEPGVQKPQKMVTKRRSPRRSSTSSSQDKKVKLEKEHEEPAEPMQVQETKAVTSPEPTSKGIEVVSAPCARRELVSERLVDKSSLTTVEPPDTAIRPARTKEEEEREQDNLVSQTLMEISMSEAPRQEVAMDRSDARSGLERPSNSPLATPLQSSASAFRESMPAVSASPPVSSSPGTPFLTPLSTQFSTPFSTPLTSPPSTSLGTARSMHPGTLTSTPRGTTHSAPRGTLFGPRSGTPLGSLLGSPRGPPRASPRSLARSVAMSPSLSPRLPGPMTPCLPSSVAPIFTPPMVPSLVSSIHSPMTAPLGPRMGPRFASPTSSPPSTSFSSATAPSPALAPPSTPLAPLPPPPLPPAAIPAAPARTSSDESRSSPSGSGTAAHVGSLAASQGTPSEGNASPTSFDESVSNGGGGGGGSSSADHKDRGLKRLHATPSGGTTKKHKRNHKRASASHKKDKHEAGHSSDSEDLPALSTGKVSSQAGHHGTRSPRGTKSPAHSCPPTRAHGESRVACSPPRAGRWTLLPGGTSFLASTVMETPVHYSYSDLSSLAPPERIVVLQDKLQEIRRCYMSLKSEVATIDRRRKKNKRKEREATATTATSSGSGSESTLGSVSPAQNTVPVECR